MFLDLLGGPHIKRIIDVEGLINEWKNANKRDKKNQNQLFCSTIFSLHGRLLSNIHTPAKETGSAERERQIGRFTPSPISSAFQNNLNPVLKHWDRNGPAVEHRGPSPASNV